MPAKIMAGPSLLMVLNIAVKKLAMLFSRKQVWNSLFIIGILSYHPAVFVFTVVMLSPNGKIICSLLLLAGSILIGLSLKIIKLLVRKDCLSIRIVDFVM